MNLKKIGIPLLSVLLAQMSGILLVYWGGLPLWAIIASGTAFFAVSLAMRRFYLSLSGLAMVAGAMGMWASTSPPVPAELAGGYVAVWGGTVEEVSSGNDSQRLIVSIDSPSPLLEGEQLRVMVRYMSSWPVVREGSRVRFGGRLTAVEDEGFIPDEVTLDSFFKRKGVVGKVVVKSDSLEVTAPPPLVERWLLDRRDALSVSIRRSGLSVGGATLLEAVLTGNTEFVGRDVREAFSEAGVAHVLALSGTHVAVIAFFIGIIFFPVTLAGGSRGKGWAVVAALWLYALFTGMPVSVVRAVVMASFVVMARMAGRTPMPFSSLFGAAVVILAFSPRSLLSVGFQLSFLAVMAILMFSFELSRPFMKSRWVVRNLWQWMMVSLSAVVGTAPLAAWYFHRIPLLFLLSNIPMVGLLPVFMGGGLVLLLLDAAGIPSGWLAGMVDATYRLICSVVDTVAGIPYGSVNGVYFDWWILLPVYGAVVMAWVALSERRMVFAISGLLLVAFSVCVFSAGKECYPVTEAFFVSDDYSTGILVRDGDRAYFTSDGREELAESNLRYMRFRVSDYLSKRGIDSLETSPVTHRGVNFAVNGRLMAVGPTVIARVDSIGDLRPLPEGTKPVYAVVGKGFRGDVMEVAKRLHPDTVVISAAVYPSRAKAFADTLASHSVPTLVAPSRRIHLSASGAVPAVSER